MQKTKSSGPPSETLLLRYSITSLILYRIGKHQPPALEKSRTVITTIHQSFVCRKLKKYLVGLPVVFARKFEMYDIGKHLGCRKR